jgi:hypothetical protein
VKDPNKIYEKYKIVSNMEEYLGYLNNIKNVHQDEGHQGGYQKRSHHYKSDYKGKPRRPRDFKDLDDLEVATANQGQRQAAGKRKLISYDDL